MVKPKLRLKLWEFTLILLGLLVCLVSLFAYVTDYPLWRLISNVQDEEVERVSIGRLSKQVGQVKRQFYGEPDFNTLKENDALFLRDIVVTSNHSNAVLHLDDGDEIEVGPSTMVRLGFESEVTLGGIHRYGKLEVISGNLTARASQKKLKIVSRGRSYTVAPNSNQSVTVQETQRQKISQLDSKSYQTLSKPTEASSFVLAPIPSPSPKISPSPSPSPFVSPSPSPSPSPSVSPSPAPVLKKKAPKCKDLKLLPPSIGGSNSNSNKLNGALLSSFEIKLNWEEIPGVEEYKLWVSKSPHAKKALLERSVPSGSHILNKNKVFAGEFYYKVSALTKAGACFNSQMEKFSFKFAPPLPVLPNDKQIIQSSKLKNNTQKVIMTWEKTNFTKFYEIEIAQDAQFQKVVFKKVLRENFLVFTFPSAGEYWWRVRGVASKISSPFCGAVSFKVVP
jgi:hypothetical protein